MTITPQKKQILSVDLTSCEHRPDNVFGVMDAHAAEPQSRILIVEDDPDIATSLEYTFKREGFAITIAPDGGSALEALKQSQPDLVLLDLNLPDLPGLEVLKDLKRSPELAHTRVIVVTARKDEIDRILGLELGADDYVNKPFSPRELVLRARAVLQRKPPTSQCETERNRISVGPIEMDLEFHRAWVEGTLIDLTLTEFKLLADLVRANGRVRSRELLLSTVWGYDSEVMSRTVDTHVRRLRSKLGPAASWLHTVRGIGYRIQRPR